MDERVAYSFLQKSVLEDLKLQYEPCHDPAFEDDRGQMHTPIGKIDLVWHKPNNPKENTETFHVVESCQPIMKLKTPNGKDVDNGVRPVELGAQTTGTACDCSVPLTLLPMCLHVFANRKWGVQNRNRFKRRRKQSSKRNELKRRRGKKNEIERSNSDKPRGSNTRMCPDYVLYADISAILLRNVL